MIIMKDRERCEGGELCPCNNPATETCGHCGVKLCIVHFMDHVCQQWIDFWKEVSGDTEVGQTRTSDGN